jgi:DNA-binding transcriptional regulator GbsR (MarR family)
MPRSTAQQKIDRYFPSNPIAYQPYLVLLFGPATGIFLYQLLYWDQKGSNKSGWIYKTMEEFKKETGLSRSNQETAIKQLVKLNLLEYRLAQVPRKRHFRLRLNILEQVLVGMLKDKHINYLNVTHTNANRANSSLPESSTLIHKTTHEITQETTSKTTGNAGILDKDSFKREKEKLMEKMGINELVPNDFDNKEQVNGQ